MCPRDPPFQKNQNVNMTKGSGEVAAGLITSVCVSRLTGASLLLNLNVIIEGRSHVTHAGTI